MASIASVASVPPAPRRYRPLNIVLPNPSDPDLVCVETRASIALWKRHLAEDAANDAMADMVDANSLEETYGVYDRLPHQKL